MRSLQCEHCLRPLKKLAPIVGAPMVEDELIFLNKFFTNDSRLLSNTPEDSFRARSFNKISFDSSDFETYEF